MLTAYYYRILLINKIAASIVYQWFIIVVQLTRNVQYVDGYFEEEI